ncbi:MAG: methionine--tRNA ligase [Candidatus Peregrinibacteria bacterium]|nr:methionine--tRNA ligase [Candidatus Peregrinibacteria bacterium]MCB9808300.1 methionine--tRNA ligase [Candidatus Peribacteria bacterium]
MKQYITTAIDYPNAAPHMGHVLEKVLADVIARWFRLRGDAVRFQIGTDEHGIKIQRTAEDGGITPQELVDRNVPFFQELYQKLHISHDYFIRTSDQTTHWPTVMKLWEKLVEAEMLTKRSYTGFYCSGCERFMTKRDLDEKGECPNHKKKPEEVTEENWFFLMSKDTQNLKSLLTDAWDGESYRIVPELRANETLALIDQGLEDVSFSRPTSSLTWGIPVPGDADQTMYVWCDALTNYISGLDYFGLNQSGPKDGAKWWDDAHVTHVIGKDIARFHALIWPDMLKHSGVRIPDQLLIHGFLTSEGEKMSKSLGNVVKPEEVLEKFSGNPDPIRFYLSHEVPVGRDGDFSWKRFEELYDAKLRNALGNLLNRVLVLLQKEGGNIDIPSIPEFEQQAKDGWDMYQNAMDRFDLHDGLQGAMRLVDLSNAGIDATKPWTLTGTEKIQNLSCLAESLRLIGLLLLPFIPDTAQRISKQLNVPYAEEMLNKNFVLKNDERDLTEWGSVRKDWKQIGEPSILFAPIL